MCDFVRTDDGVLDDVRNFMNFDIIYKDVTGSTNDDVWDLADHGAHPGVAVRALRQESGRGQWKTRPWVSPEGGLYFSVLLEPRIPEEEFPSMSPRLAEAVARIVRSIAGVTENEVWIKPANDVMCEAGKLCGMSLDAKDGKVVLGVGVNVFHPKEAIVTDGRNVAAYVCDLGTEESRSLPFTNALSNPLLRVQYLDAVMQGLLGSIDLELSAIECEHI